MRENINGIADWRRLTVANIVVVVCTMCLGNAAPPFFLWSLDFFNYYCFGIEPVFGATFLFTALVVMFNNKMYFTDRGICKQDVHSMVLFADPKRLSPTVGTVVFLLILLT